MRRLASFVRILVLSLLTMNFSYAEVQGSAELATGFTSNALYTADDKTSDVFLKGALGLRTWAEGDPLRFRLLYTDFLKTDSRDLISPRLSYLSRKAAGDWDLRTELVYAHYLRTSPGYEDDAFDSLGGSIGIEREMDAGNAIDFTPAFRYRLTRYLEGSTRTDHQFSGEADFRLPMSGASAGTEFYFGGDLSLLFSSDEFFSHRGLGLFGGAVLPVDARSRFDFGLSLSRIVYFNRTESTITIVRTRRGATRASSIEEKETRTWFQLHGSYEYDLTESLDFQTRLALSRQRSGSGAQDYSVLDAEVGVVYQF